MSKRHADMTAEQLEKVRRKDRLRMRKRRASMTPEEHEKMLETNRAWKEKNPGYWRERSANMTSEQRDKKKEYLRKRWVAMTPEEREQRREQSRRRYANLSPEKLEKLRASKCAYSQHPKQREKRRAQAEERRRKYAEKTTLEQRRAVVLQKVYGITLEDYKNLIISQGGLCAICGRKLSKKPKRPHHVDHDHAKTGRESVRGVVHGRCNTLLGHFERDVGMLYKIEAYLRKHGQVQSFASPPPHGATKRG